MPFMVRVLFQIASHYPVNRRKIRLAVSQSLAGLVKRNAEVSVSVVGSRRMKELNSRYRNRDYATDVLSFPLNETSDPGKPFVMVPDNILRLGDIVVCYPQAVEEARKSNRLVDDVINELVLHGLNHLMGIHHEE
jgi:probable rRNA maturation factor